MEILQTLMGGEGAWLDLGVYLMLGVVAGLLAGLLGVGGGLVIVPALFWLFAAHGFAPGIVAQLAVGTSLTTIVFTSLASVRAHQRRRAVRWELFRALAPGIVVGSLAGAVVADLLPSESLRRIFGVFALAVGVQMALVGRLPQGGADAPRRPGVSGGMIGLVSAIVGVGGGSLTVPYLVHGGVGMRGAVATSSACGLPIAVAGACGFLVSGWNESALPPGASGYIYWPAVPGIIGCSILFAPLGARLAHAIPVQTLKRLFALLLLLLGGKLLLF